MPRSSRSWCDTADSLMPTSVAMSQTQSSPAASASRMRTRVGIAEDPERLGERLDGVRRPVSRARRTPPGYGHLAGIGHVNI